MSREYWSMSSHESPMMNKYNFFVFDASIEKNKVAITTEFRLCTNEENIYFKNGPISIFCFNEEWKLRMVTITC